MVIMMRILLLIIILLLPLQLQAAELITLDWEANPGWLASGNDSTFMVLDFEDGSGPLKRRIGVRFLNHGMSIAEVWDAPSARSINTSVDLAEHPTARITAQATAYAAPWQPLTAYVIGDKISVGDYPSSGWWMEATSAGSSGATEPEWPAGHPFSLALEKTLSAAAAVDNGDGTVTLPMPLPADGEVTHLFRAGDLVTISGTVNYNGDTILPDQTGAADGELLITASYVAETFAGTETVRLSGRVAVDNGNGTVSLPCPDHGYVGGESVEISGTTNYDGSYTLAAQADPDVLTITATYVAEVINGGSVRVLVVSDGSVVWTFTIGELPTGETETTGRIVGKLRAGKMVRGGVQYRGDNVYIRSAP